MNQLRLRRLSRVFLPAVAVTLAATVAAPQPSGGQSPDPPAPVVRIPFPQEDGSLTPYTFELGYQLMTLVYDTLLWRDAAGIPQPWLARSVEISDDQRRLTLRLHEGVRWHDGAPLTSGDVAFTLRFVNDHPHPRFSPPLEPVERVETPDPATVVISLRRPSPGFPDQPLSDLPILPSHLWRALPPGAIAPEGPPIGSGPYRLVDHQSGKSYRFEANAGYFRGPPTVTALEVPILRTVDETLDALRQRRVDMIPVSLSEAASESLTAPGIRLREGPSFLGTVLMFNLRQAPFDRQEVRAAVAASLDLDRLARAAATAVPADRGYLHPASRWSSEAVLHPARPPAGSALPDLGLPPIEVLAPDNDPVRLEAGRQVALALERAGVQATSRAVSRSELSRAVGEDGTPPSFQAAIWGAPPLASYDPDFLLRLFGSNLRQSPFNYSGYASAAFDELAGRVATTPDPAARRAVVGDQLALLSRDLPVVPLFFAEGRYAYRPAIHDGWVFVKGSGILDKRSFTDPPPPAPPVPPPAPPDTASGGRGLFGLLAIALVGVAGLIGAVIVVGWMRERSAGRTRRRRA